MKESFKKILVRSMFHVEGGKTNKWQKDLIPRKWRATGKNETATGGMRYKGFGSVGAE